MFPRYGIGWGSDGGIFFICPFFATFFLFLHDQIRVTVQDWAPSVIFYTA